MMKTHPKQSAGDYLKSDYQNSGMPQACPVGC